MSARRGSIVCALVVLALTLASCGAERTADSRKAVASVAGTTVQPAALSEWTRIDLATGQAKSRSTASQQALDLLITWAWLEAEAKALKVDVPASQVNEALFTINYHLTRDQGDSEFKAGEGALRPYIASARVPKAAQLKLTQMWLLASRLSARRIQIRAAQLPQQQVSTYYHRHLHDFLTEEHRGIKAIINFSRAKVVEAKHEIEAGVNFQLVAKRFNQNSEGGLQTSRPRGHQEKRLEGDYFGAPAHVLIGPLKEWLWYVFEVFKIMRPHPRPLATVEASIRRTLAAREDTAGATARVQAWQARTSCRTGYASARCGRYEAELADSS
jgi:hypothetical protein